MGFLGDRFGRTKGSAWKDEHQFVVQAYREALNVDAAHVAQSLSAMPDPQSFTLLLDVADQHAVAWQRAIEGALENRRLFPGFDERLGPVESQLVVELADAVGADRERFADATIRAGLDREARSMPGKANVPRSCLYMTYRTYDDAAQAAAHLPRPDSISLQADTAPHADCGLYHVRSVS